ncbi:MAG: cytochrome c maturation protein CcmE [Caldilineales bacterium]|nr:cytochrome c maturation protein CcmE [Caldilineales bacterium]
MADSIAASPQIAAKNPNKKIKFIVGGVLIVAAILYLVFTSIQSTGAYYMTVAEVNDDAAALMGKKIRVSGAVVHNSENWDAVNLLLSFDLTDETGDNMTVSFHGSRPSNFGRATEAIVEGELSSDGVFRADTLLLKCPSRYEEAPEVTQFEALSDS